MPEIIDIKTAELIAAHNDAIIKTGSLGSCLAIVLYDSEKGIGGMAHAMLPNRKKRKGKQDSSKAPAKYVDEAIDNLIEAIEKIGGRKNELIAKIVGGAAMFKRLTNEQHSIGFKNIEAAKNHLTEIGIEIEGQDSGGSSGKIVEMNLANGVVEVSTKL